MAGRGYGIRISYLLPLGVDLLLLSILLLLVFLRQGEAAERIVFPLFFLLVLLLFLEGLGRRVKVTDEGVTVFRFWRSREVPWRKINHIGFLRLGKKAYMLLTTGKGFFVISNAYDGFNSLAEEIMARVDKDKVDDPLPLQTERGPAGQVIAAWVAAAGLAGVIALKLFPVAG